jgi:mannose-1-phosphate guanylyltransferase/mannose-6-phosphate isomerase
VHQFEATMTLPTTSLIVPAIMSGGSGTRLWPLSTDAQPKQFHALAGTETLFRQTLARLSGDADGASFTAPIIIGNAAQADLIERELAAAGIAPAAIVLEPEGRHTAAAAATAAALARDLFPGAPVFLAPADHVIEDETRFRALVANGARLARERIVTFGIVPDRAETGYGYIEAGESIAHGALAIRSFKEKPGAELAEAYVASGRYFWNGGMFLFDPDLMLAEFASAADVRDAALSALATARREGPRIWLGPDFARVRSVAVDIAVMQETKKGAVIPLAVGWADVGSWFELWRLRAETPAANVVDGPAIVDGSTGSLVLARGIAVAAMGLDGFVVVATPEAVLILPKDRAQDVKLLRERILALKHPQRSE